MLSVSFLFLGEAAGEAAVGEDDTAGEAILVVAELAVEARKRSLSFTAWVDDDVVAPDLLSFITLVDVVVVLPCCITILLITRPPPADVVVPPAVC